MTALPGVTALDGCRVCSSEGDQAGRFRDLAGSFLKVEIFPLRSFAPPLIRRPTQAAQRAAWTSGGAVAQLVERLNGIQEVRGSIPLGSTKFTLASAR